MTNEVRVAHDEVEPATEPATEPALELATEPAREETPESPPLSLVGSSVAPLASSPCSPSASLKVNSSGVRDGRSLSASDGDGDGRGAGAGGAADGGGVKGTGGEYENESVLTPSGL